MTSFDIAAVIRELSPRISGSRVSNIYQTNASMFFLKLHQREEEDLWLLIEPGRRLHLTTFSVEKIAAIPQFCRNLRKYLKNSILVSIRQIQFERIVEIIFSVEREEYRLMIEVFGKGNALLISPSEEILHAMHFRRMKDRNIIRGEHFSLPPSSGANPWTEFQSSLNRIHDLGKLEIVRGLTRTFSMGGLYSEELLLRSNINKQTPSSELSQEQFLQLQEAAEALKQSLFLEDLKTEVILDPDGKWIDVVPFPLKGYESLKKLTFATSNEAYDEYFAQKAAQVEEKEESEEKKNADEQLRVLSFQRGRLEEQIREAERLKESGDLAYLHYPELSNILQKARIGISLEKSPGEIRQDLLSDKPININIGEVRFDEAKSVELELDGTKIVIDLDESMQQNADRYYAMAKETRLKLNGLRRAIETTEAKLDLLTQRAETKKPQPKIPQKRRRSQWFDKFRWFHSSEGFLVLGGKDASTNEILIKRQMTSTDIVAHAEITGAPFVLVKTGGREVSEVTLREACQFAVSTSRAWRLGLGSVDAYWVRPDQVSSAPPPGQFLEKGMFMIYGSRNNIHGIPLQLAIGVIEEENMKLLGGPPSSVSSKTRYFVEIVPGHLSNMKLAEEVRSALARLVPSELSLKVSSAPLEDFQELLPPGKGRLSKAKK